MSLFVEEGGRTSEKEEAGVIKGVRSLMDQCFGGGRGEHEDGEVQCFSLRLREAGDYMGRFQGGREPR